MKNFWLKKFLTTCFLTAATGAYSEHASNIEPKEVVRQYFDYLKSGQFEELMNLFSDDIIWHQPGQSHLAGTYRGKKQVAELFGRFMQLSQNSFKIDQVDDVMSNQNLVTATLSFSAQSGEQSLQMRGVDLMRVDEGKIAEVYLFSQDQAQEDAFWDKLAQ